MHDIFKYFIAKGDEDDNRRLAYASWFCTNFPIQEFRREEAIFMHYLLYSTKLGLPAKRISLDAYLQSEMRAFLVKEKIKIDGTESCNFEEPTSTEVAIRTTKEVMNALFREMESEKIDLADFIVTVDQFIKQRLNERTVEVFSKAYDMFSGKNDSVEMATYALESQQLLADIYDPAKLEEIIDAPDTVEDAEMTFLIDTGLPGIDNVVYGLCRKQLGGIEAPPGAGKTRFALGVWAHRAAVTYGLNVVFFALEQTRAEVKAMLIARHVLHLYGKLIPDKMITSNSVPDELSAIVKASQLDLFDSGKYGKIHIVETNLYVEDFIDKVKNQDRLYGPFDIVIIDHMYLMESRSEGRSRPDQVEIIRKSYRKFKRYVRSTGKGGIAVNQFNREGIEASKQDKEVDATMAAGGIEAYRNTDFNIAITFNETMLAQGKRKVSIPKARSTEPFMPIVVDTRLGSCYFYQVAAKEL
jgi:KaiC/GvpD/RAD55 family RecA-like ATPase